MVLSLVVMRIVNLWYAVIHLDTLDNFSVRFVAVSICFKFRCLGKMYLLRWCCWRFTKNSRSCLSAVNFNVIVQSLSLFHQPTSLSTANDSMPPLLDNHFYLLVYFMMHWICALTFNESECGHLVRLHKGRWVITLSII